MEPAAPVNGAAAPPAQAASSSGDCGSGAVGSGPARWFQVQSLPNLGMGLKVGESYSEDDLLQRCPIARKPQLEACLLDERVFLQVTCKKGRSRPGPKAKSKADPQQQQPQQHGLRRNGFARRSAGTLVKCILERTVLRQR
eukprot:TRINITY_DN3857_c0_g1_i1.p1 TRINITY_DN3857_c0_g1~~TRINITY_DN3857_c0_g1_i1.p1  ORF type:complete len:141 (-),score=12.57 TRINITY_DN3857_c0_g1_i1:278-700(-)